MYRILSASKDSYITNKIINNKFRAEDANVGQAGTLDLFKLYNESTISGETAPIELSRLLIKFDLAVVKSMHENKHIDVGSNSFKAYLKLHDVYGGQTTPKNFHVISFPLSKSFDEGDGFDVVNYQDVGTANWLTSSYFRSVEKKWNQTGARASGSWGDTNIDVVVSGTVTGSPEILNFSSEMYFETGEEDLELDVTNFVSASIKDLVPNNGFVIALSGAYEKNTKSYFVKRFGSRNTLNTAIRPKLIIKFDDSINDNLENFEFDTTGSLYLQNFSRGNLTNLISGSAGTSITGQNCMILKIESGSFSKQFDVSQVIRGASKKATATITITGNPTDNRQIHLIDATNHKESFTFDADSDNTWSNVIGYQSFADSNTNIAKQVVTSVNTNSSLAMSASSLGAVVTFVQDYAGELGNTTVDGSTVTNISTTNFTGGSYDGLAGIYSSSFSISSFETLLYDHVIATGSISFDQIWSNHNEAVTYLSSSMTIKKTSRNNLNFGEQRIITSVMNLKPRYKQTEKVRFRVFVENANKELTLRKVPYETPSEIYNKMYYRVRDADTDDIIIPFDTSSTRLSNDSKAMYFDFYMSSLPKGKSYFFDFLVVENSFDLVLKTPSKFIIE